MFDIGFSEILLIFIIALVVLGPEKLPRLASQVGRWIGRARAMARQFKEQLEEEVNLEEVRKAQEPRKPSSSSTSAETPPAGSDAAATTSPPAATQPGSSTIDSASAHLQADTFSHAHPTNEHGANPNTANGAAEEPPASQAWSAHGAETRNPSDEAPYERTDTVSSEAPSETSANGPSLGDADSPHRQARSEAYAPATPSARATDRATTNPTPQHENAGADPHGQA